jgi:hypothetical protein
VSGILKKTTTLSLGAILLFTFLFMSLSLYLGADGRIIIK